MTSSTKAMSINQTKTMLIIKLKSPKVKIFKGKDKTSRIGLMKKLTIPKTAPMITKVFQLPETLTPLTNSLANQMPAVDPATLKMRFHIALS